MYFRFFSSTFTDNVIIYISKMIGRFNVHINYVVNTERTMSVSSYKNQLHLILPTLPLTNEIYLASRGCCSMHGLV